MVDVDFRKSNALHSYSINFESITVDFSMHFLG